jgi:hypothetical protein
MLNLPSIFMTFYHNHGPNKNHSKQRWFQNGRKKMNCAKNLDSECKFKFVAPKMQIKCLKYFARNDDDADGKDFDANIKKIWANLPGRAVSSWGLTFFPS